MDKVFSFPYKLIPGIDALEPQDALLLRAAIDAQQLAYAPYSRFEVGAALLLESGAIVKGGNQENASYPAGICAERTALSAASSLHPGVPLIAVAIAYRNLDRDDQEEMILSPCGICRQSLMETYSRQEKVIKMIMSSPSGSIIVLESVENLLPFGFSKNFL